MTLDATTAAWVEAVATVIGAIAAIAAVFVAYRQLSNLNTTLRMSVLAAVLQLESEMNARKRAVDEAACQVSTECAKSKRNEKAIQALTGKMEGLLESWLNAVDRFAYCIRHGYLAERDWKSEYREMFFGLVRDHPEKFGPQSVYTNIIDLTAKWKRE